MNLPEEWRPIVGFEDRYEVSSLGRVRSIDTGLIRKPSVHAKGYHLIGLRKPGVNRAYLLHGIVAEAFLGPRPDGFHCCHLNGVRTDNRVENLTYATAKVNCSHKKLHGTHQAGERHGSAKLTEADVSHIRQTYDGRQREFARQYGVNRSTIRRIVNGQGWQCAGLGWRVG